ncbi:MAG: hypothetical protein K1X57_06715 [Gemmataceae bacterium]|nr:hypothetical protein [Gemmataceae bacterium]
MTNRTRLSLNSLETRLTPAASISYVGGSLTVTGDQTANAISLLATANNTFQVSVNAANLGTYAVSGNVTVNGGNSADTVTVNLGAFSQNGNLTANLGNGNDSFSLEMAGGSLSGALAVRAGLGDDAIRVNAVGSSAIGTVAGMVTLDGNLGSDNVSLGNGSGVSSFQGLVNVTGANNVQWSTSQNDLYGNNVMFSPGSDSLGLSLNEGNSGGSNLVTVAGSVRIIGSGSADTIFLRGMAVGGEMLASLGAGANGFAVSSSAASVTNVNGAFSYIGGSGAENVDLSSGKFDSNVNLNTFDGNDSINLNVFAAPTFINGNLTINTGNGNITYTGGGIGAQIAGNVNITQGNGNSTIPFAANGNVSGSITVRTGGGSTLLQFLGAQTYNVNANLGAGNDTIEINNAAGSIFGVLDGGAGVNQFLQTAGTIASPFYLFNF